jgi:hypothetical protein
MSMNSTLYNPEEFVKGEIRSIREGPGLSEFQEIGVEYILTQKDILHKDKYYMPKNVVVRFRMYG